MKDDHLMNPAKLFLFASMMNIEQQRHKDEKIPMAGWEDEAVIKHCKEEIESRLEQAGTPEKQLVHCANFLFFMWYKLYGDNYK